MNNARFLSGESDIFVGRRSRLKRYLVCSLQGYFPVLAKIGPQSLAVIFRTGATHVGVSGTLAVSTSGDGGKSWSDPVEIAPRWDDCRNPAFGVNKKGELIAAYWKSVLHNYEDTDGTGLRYSAEAGESRWESVPALYVCRSSDDGRTWTESAAYSSNLLSLASPYGRIITAPDGTLLMSVYGRQRGNHEREDLCILLRSVDGGATWGDETITATGYNETSYVFLPDGTLVAAARSTSGHVAILRSADGGRTWSKPEQVTRDGEHPADLTLLDSGRLLLTFGRRIRPTGCGVLLSSDGGHTWDFDHEVLLAGDGVEDVDLGYPSTVQLDDGSIVTVLYYASGSEMSGSFGGWGAISCQAIHYTEEAIH